MKPIRIHWLVGAMAALSLLAVPTLRADEHGHERHAHQRPAAGAPAGATSAPIAAQRIVPHPGLLGLHYSVALRDIRAYAAVANPDTSSLGLKMDHVDAVFIPADADLGQPHYHFAQWFTNVRK